MNKVHKLYSMYEGKSKKKKKKKEKNMETRQHLYIIFVTVTQFIHTAQ